MRYSIFGCFYGDEGKGKIVDFLSKNVDLVVRYQGGNNAGHTIYLKDEKYVFNLLPSGILYKNNTNILANGMVINLEKLVLEIKNLKKRKVWFDNIVISDRAHLILPYHILLDKDNENKEKVKIGTTKKGIGFAYQDKMSRKGIRVCDLLYPDIFKEKLKYNVEYFNKYFKNNLNYLDIYREHMNYLKEIEGYIKNTTNFLNNNKNKNILFEGTQGAMLSIEHGTYPFVTSSEPTSISIPINCGVPNNFVDKNIGIIKSYITRVGRGPFVTEIFGENAQYIREKGNEYGTVTKRPRRIGWIDIPILKYVNQINNIDYGALTLLDVLGEMKDILICDYYLNQDNKKIINISANSYEYKTTIPHYIKVKGWETDISEIREYSELPLNCQKYIELIEKLSEIKIKYISVGKERNAIIIK